MQYCGFLFTPQPVGRDRPSNLLDAAQIVLHAPCGGTGCCFSKASFNWVPHSDRRLGEIWKVMLRCLADSMEFELSTEHLGFQHKYQYMIKNAIQPPSSCTQMHLFNHKPLCFCTSVLCFSDLCLIQDRAHRLQNGDLQAELFSILSLSISLWSFSKACLTSKSCQTHEVIADNSSPMAKDGKTKLLDQPVLLLFFHAPPIMDSFGHIVDTPTSASK